MNLQYAEYNVLYIYFVYTVGKLQAPTGLIPEINEQNISLSWVPPYTLPNTSMEFMVSVSVLGHSNSDILEVFSPNLTLFYYTLNISRVSNHTIEFTVWAVNPAGEGDSATIEVIIPVLDRRLPPGMDYVSNYNYTTTYRKYFHTLYLQYFVQKHFKRLLFTK